MSSKEGTSQKIPRVPENVNFSKNEEDVLALWKKLDVFKTCLKQSKKRPKYSFYDGPPFATGLPHYGHILAGTIKDVVTRYAHMQGFHVDRRFGWDCHGLPIEYEIDKSLGIKGPDDVMRMGIKAYNDECRKIVTRYVNEWEVIMGRIGRWVDFVDDYKTMYPWFMESIWWIFSQLYNKGLVYCGNKIMPYSTACNTPLSNFESGQNYKDVIDPAVTVTLPLIGDKDNASLLIWTTTPWTLPSNLAACVHPTHSYAKVKQTSSGNVYWVMEARISSVFKKGDFAILQKCPGADLKGLEYKPIFDYFAFMKKQGAFHVVVDEYVTTESGTGIVHQAAYFGEDDYRVCLANGIITKDQDPICPIDASGRLVEPVHDFAGQYIKDADKNIIAALKANNRLFHLTQVNHSYPFCWRSDTPLIYRAVPSWFVRVEFMSELLLKASAETYWVPAFVQERRFANWLKDSRDWAVSRNRYWGTPIPIWMSPDGEEVVCISSVQELRDLTGVDVKDLHRETIDQLEIPSLTPGNPPLRRIPEVFDCWFESGSMPYAQQHFPFQNHNMFYDIFPADFIAEGIDQTRGWFYTLLVISTALFGKAPFKNLIANGLVLASDGQKMSKRKKNYPDPMEVVNKYGADALRLYLISSPVVRAENLRFKEEGVRDIIKDVFLPWYNAFRFLMQNVEVYVEENKCGFIYDEKDLAPTNIMDRWILSFTQTLLKFVGKEMKLYHLYNVLPRLTKYIDYLTNWYVRMNRKRLKGEAGQEDCKQALLTLFNVLFNIVKIMAPFTPFLAESIYQYLKALLPASTAMDSVHYFILPKPNEDLIDHKIERGVARLQAVIDLGRIIRDRNNLPLKIPLPEIFVLHQDEVYLADMLELDEYIRLELNVRVVTLSSDRSRFGVAMRAEPDFATLGAKLKNDFKKVTQEIKGFTDAKIREIRTDGFTVVCGHRIERDEFKFILHVNDESTKKHIENDGDVVVILNANPDQGMIDEGTAREVVNRIQKLRKKAKVVPTDKITIYVEADGEVLRVCQKLCKDIEQLVKAPFKLLQDAPSNEILILAETQELKNCKLVVSLRKVSNKLSPRCKWSNLEVLGDVETRYCNRARRGSILLDPKGVFVSFEGLVRSIEALFGIPKRFNMFADGKLVTAQNYAETVCGRVIYVTYAQSAQMGVGGAGEGEPFCEVVYDSAKGLSEFIMNPVA